ncbi:signal peptidase I [Candidatus Roizmanbacteria bacterium CG11_big_fil_rev_8_21_14_0_20_36_8]|nr:MAG: signal peptidase I [Candidatus Roizmanbacteria bacterium CG11_big_fil_rev_8_21_14_0_20_36_8]
MSPTIVQGDLIMTKKSSVNSYLKGDIISFYSDRFEPNGIITHRIIGVENKLLTTKGDSNAVSDVQRVNPNLIVGKVISIIPYLGYWVMSMNSVGGKVFFLIMPMIVIVYSEIKVIEKYSKSLY